MPEVQRDASVVVREPLLVSWMLELSTLPIYTKPLAVGGTTVLMSVPP